MSHEFDEHELDDEELDDEDFAPEERKTPFGSVDETPEQALARKAERLDLAKISRSVLEKMVRDHVDVLIKTRVKEELDDIFEHGWVHTNEYGERHHGTAKVTLRDRVAKFLTVKQRYNNNTFIESHIERVAKASTEKAVDKYAKEFKAELEEFKRKKMHDKLRAILDGDIFR